MKDTYLVQRLCAPTQNKKINEVHRVFGGAMVGLSEQAWDLLDPIFRVDYMGAAEFEFGTIPKTLKSLSEDNLVAGAFVVKAHQIEPSMWIESSVEPYDRTVYYVCRAEHRKGVEERICELASNKLRLKEISYVAEGLNPRDEYESKYIGWLELDNGFFFFVDETAWRETCKLFGVEIDDQASA